MEIHRRSRAFFILNTEAKTQLKKELLPFIERILN